MQPETADHQQEQMKNVCRICSVQKRICLIMDSPLDEMRDKFKASNFYEVFNYLTGLYAHEKDHMPNQLCFACALDAVNACVLIQKCREADENFRKKLKIGEFYHDDVDWVDQIELESEETAIDVKQEAEDNVDAAEDEELNVNMETYQEYEENIQEEVYENYEIDGLIEEVPRTEDDDHFLADDIITEDLIEESIEEKLEEYQEGYEIESVDQIEEDEDDNISIDDISNQIIEEESQSVTEQEKDEDYNVNSDDEEHRNEEEIQKQFNDKKYVPLKVDEENFDDEKYILEPKRKPLRFACPIELCPQIYTAKSHLKRHMIKAHKDNKPIVHECQICHSVLASEKSLKSHMQGKHGDRSLKKCDECGKVFMRDVNLRNHLKMHRGETIDCEYCGKKFTKKYELDIHRRFHTKEFPYLCTQCPKKLPTLGALNLHIEKHNGIRYPCEVCGQVFQSKASMRLHSFKHNERMPYDCPVTNCPKSYPTKARVRMHLRKSHKIEGDYFDELMKMVVVNSEVADQIGHRVLNSDISFIRATSY